MKLFTRKEVREDHKTSLDHIRAEEMKALKALKEKVSKINELDAVYPVELAKKQKELADADLRIRTLLAGQEREIRILEERRLQALSPIVDELNRLELAKLDLQKTFVSLDEKKLEIEKAGEHLRLKENELKAQEHDLSVTRQEVGSYLERQKIEANALIANSKVFLVDSERERKLAAEVQTRLQAKKQDAERAEAIAKAAMVAVDKRIALEREEQRKTDDKRKMLATVIKLLKDKGLWHSIKNKKSYGL